MGLSSRTCYLCKRESPQAQGFDKQGIEQILKFAGVVAAIIKATPAERILRTDIYDRAPIDCWHSGRVVLLGDAAHPMTPNLGQGAGQAIEDAVVLDDCLARTATIEDALMRYEQRRVARANGIVRASRQFGAIAQWSNPVAAWLRDRVMSLTPPSAAIRQARRLMEY